MPRLRTPFLSLLCGGIVSLFCAATGANAAVEYWVKVLPVYDEFVVATAINDSGQVVGYSEWFGVYGGGEGRAFFYWQGRINFLPKLPTARYDDWTRAFGINDDGEIVGESDNKAVFWNRKGKVIQLGVPGTDSVANGINASGQIAGTTRVNYQDRAFLYFDGTAKILDPLSSHPEVASTSAAAINDAGQVVGRARVDDPSFNDHAFLYSDSKMIDLGTLGGRESRANSIDPQGRVVGSSETAEVDSYGNHDWTNFLYEGGKMTELPGADGDDPAINALGQIVAGPNLLKDGRFVDLNTLISPTCGIEIREARDINSAGIIVGTGDAVWTRRKGYSRAFVLRRINPDIAPPVLRMGRVSRLVVSGGKISFRGKASGAVSAVTFRVGKGGYQIAEGTLSWLVEQGRLRPGAYPVTVVAHGPGGDSEPVKVHVVLR